MRLVYSLKAFVIVVSIIYTTIVGFFFLKQRDFQYDREGRVYSVAETSLQRTTAVKIRTVDGSELLAWYAPPTGALPTILYFRGKTGSFSREYERFEAFERDGYGFLSFDYRGFPGSPGELTEQNALADSLVAFDWLASKGGSIVLWGRSLGSGPATYVASRRDAEALVLESPFRSAVAVAQESFWWLPVGLIMQDRYPVERWIRDVQAPVFVAHGAIDPAIKVANGQAIFQLAPHGVALWIDQQGDHDNLWAHGIWPRVRDFIDAVHGGKTPAPTLPGEAGPG